MRWVPCAMLLLASATALGQVAGLNGETVCEPLHSGLAHAFGPFDYNDPAMRVPTPDTPQTRLKLVENAHFRPDREQILKGHDRTRLYGDIAYTLRVIPNHHGALDAVSRLERQSGGKLPGSNGKPPNTAECWFDRAMRFRPRDGMVQYIYGIHNHALKRYEIAETAYLTALQLGVTSPQVNYNLGLLYADTRQFEKAQEQARIAYAGGVALPGLRERLTREGFAP